MTNEFNEQNLLKPGLLGNWIAKRFDIWQLRFVSGNELGRIAEERGLMPLTLEGHIKSLWQLGLLQADLIESSTKLTIEHLDLVDQGKNSYFYSDNRRLQQSFDGWGGTIAKPTRFSSGLELYFHPFRYYVLYHIDRILRINIHPIQLLSSNERYGPLFEQMLSEFQEWSKKPDFPKLINHWNDVASLAIASEPHTFTRIFGIRRRSASTSEEEHNKLVAEHWNEFRTELLSIGIDKIEKVHQELCINAEMLDSNKNVHTMLRLTDNEMRLKAVKGTLGGAMYLLTMAEMIRRSAENTFNINLPEENDVGVGPIASKIKQNLYGTDRLLDSNPATKNLFLRTLGLDYGVRLRWYVEGYTEFHGLNSILGSYTLVDLVNLKGEVLAKRGKGVSFTDDLKQDLRAHVFSFVSLDKEENSNYARAASIAADNDVICGMFFISDPDFEFANFTIAELSSLVWEFAVDAGAQPEEKEKLIKAVSSCKSSREFEKLVQKTLPILNQFSKGKDWGEKLMRYAWENSEINIDENTKHVRPIIEAVNLAIKAATVDDYHATRTMFRIDPNTGKPIRRSQ